MHEQNITDYRHWIEAGYRDYGKDPWFFIRELAQNSRDAGATTIHVRTTYIPSKEEVIIFEDNGNGMSYDHAIRYLFRLYASSKENEKNAAGMFGIGFWTIFKYTPLSIIIESRTGEDKWGVILDSDLRTSRIPTDLDHIGTRITLIRTPQEPSSEAFSNTVRESLDRYCKFLRQNNSQADPLPIFFEGKNITREMQLPGPVSLQFKKGNVEGAVGLGPEPHVSLYVRGLPVWEGTTLDELSHTPPSGKKEDDIEIMRSMAPVFIINGNRLDVNISRKRVIDNKELQHVRNTSEKALFKMVENAADYVSPRSLLNWFFDKIKRIFSNTFHSFSRIMLAILILIIPVEIILITTLYKNKQDRISSGEMAIQAGKSVYSGASVRNFSQAKPLDLSFSPPVETWFRLFTADEYQPVSGFLISVRKESIIAFPKTKPGKSTISVRLHVSGKGSYFLPQPARIASPRFSIDPASIRFENSTIPTSHYYSEGQVTVEIPSEGFISYTCSPLETETEPDETETLFLETLPDTLTLPLSIENSLNRIRSQGKPVALMVRDILQYTAWKLRYDDSPAIADQYSRFPRQTPWFEKVMKIGAGDCDIINGVAVIFLRKLNIPARLAVGFVGKDGRILPNMHAWVEYFDKGLHIADATRYTNASSAPGPVPSSRPYVFIPETWQQKKTFIIRILFVILGVLVIAAVILAARIRKTSAIVTSDPDHSGNPEHFRKVREGLAGMVMHELLHPGAWGHNRGIRNYKLIPTITDRSISLKQALKLGRQRKLFAIDSESHVARYLRETSGRWNQYILDSGSEAFAPLIKLLPGIIHIKKILDLGIIEPGKLDDRVTGKLIQDVNRLLQKENRRIPLCFPATQMISGDFLDIDISILPSLENYGIPPRFIAVNPDSLLIKKISSLYSVNPPLAQLRFIRALFNESNMIPEPSRSILESISRRFLKEYV